MRLPPRFSSLSPTHQHMTGRQFMALRHTRASLCVTFVRTLLTFSMLKVLFRWTASFIYFKNSNETFSNLFCLFLQLLSVSTLIVHFLFLYDGAGRMYFFALIYDKGDNTAIELIIIYHQSN